MRLAHRNLTNWEEDPVPQFIVILVDILFWFAPVNISVSYFFALFDFGFICTHLPLGYAIAATVILTAAIIIAQFTDEGSWTNPLIWLFLLVRLACTVLGVWVSRIFDRSSRRRQLIEQLEAAQADLAAAARREGVLEERQRLARETPRPPSSVAFTLPTDKAVCSTPSSLF